MTFDKISSPTLEKFPVITHYQAKTIEYRMRFDRVARKTFHHNGVWYDIRKMTDEESEKVWDELHLYNVPI